MELPVIEATGSEPTSRTTQARKRPGQRPPPAGRARNPWHHRARAWTRARKKKKKKKKKRNKTPITEGHQREQRGDRPARRGIPSLARDRFGLDLALAEVGRKLGVRAEDRKLRDGIGAVAARGSRRRRQRDQTERVSVVRTCWPCAPSTRRRLPDRLPRASVVGREQRVLVVSVSLPARRSGSASGRPDPIPARPPASITLASAESQSLPTGTLIPSVTRSGRCVRVLRAAERPVSRLPVSARESQLAPTRNSDQMQQQAPDRRHGVAA